MQVQTTTLEEAKEKFIQSWGTLGSRWGVNRTMAQIHALLLLSKDNMHAKEIKEALNISMGNVNMNLRALMDWGLVYKESIKGERKDYYRAEKDMKEITKKIIAERKRKELEPIVKVLDEIQYISDESEEAKEFKETVKNIRLFSEKADKALSRLIETDNKWFFNTFIKIIG